MWKALLALWGVLALGALVGSQGGRCPSRLHFTRARLYQVHQSVDLFRLEQGRLPGTLEDLAEKAVDGRGRNLLYVVEADRFRIGSFGEDAKPGVDDLWSSMRRSGREDRLDFVEAELAGLRHVETRSAYTLYRFP